MSQENVEIVTGFMQAWSDHDRAEIARYLHPNAVFHSPTTNVVGETFYGREQILGALDQWAEEWAAIRWEVEEYIDVAEHRVVTLHKAIATGRASGVEVVRELAGVIDIREGHVVRHWIYLDRNEALEAAGLRE